MRKLPTSAKLYLIVLWLSTAILASTSLHSLTSLLSMPWMALAGLGAVIIANQATVMIEMREGHQVGLGLHEAVSMFFAAIIGLPGAWIVALGTLIVGLSQRRPWERVLFNAASYYLSYFYAALTYSLLQPANTIPYSGLTGIITFVGVAAAFYLSNMFLVGLMVAFATNQPAQRVYRTIMQQVNWVQLLTFTIGTSIAALWAVNAWLAIYGLLTLVIAQRAFLTVVRLNQETRKSKELAEERAKLYEEQVRLSEELHHQQAELTSASKLAALGTFAAGIAHEFNNVLTAIIGNAQVGQMSDSFAEKDYSLNVISRVSQRATSITASLLTFARQREPELNLNYLQGVINDTLALVNYDLLRDQIKITTRIDDLPPLLCDLGQMAQVLLNLITNARDALRGQANAEIKLSLTNQDEEAVLIIADNGPGIPTEVLERIFQPFVTTKKTGNGLGMSICYGIIENHKGSITIDSTLTVGTTITIRLPMAVPDEDFSDENLAVEAAI